MSKTDRLSLRITVFVVAIVILVVYATLVFGYGEQPNTSSFEAIYTDIESTELELDLLGVDRLNSKVNEMNLKDRQEFTLVVALFLLLILSNIGGRRGYKDV